MKPTLYFICGVPGAGKSWVISQLDPTTHTYISFDGTPKKDHPKLIEEAVKLGKPVLFDPTFKISTLIKRWGEHYDIRPVFILEDEETLKARIAGRGGEWTDSLAKRIIQIGKRAEKYGIFAGISTEVLDFMREQLTTEDMPSV